MRRGNCSSRVSFLCDINFTHLSRWRDYTILLKGFCFCIEVKNNIDWHGLCKNKLKSKKLKIEPLAHGLEKH
jgi:hypothetical protein